MERLDLPVGYCPLPLAWYPQLQQLAVLLIRHQEHLLNRPGRWPHVNRQSHAPLKWFQAIQEGSHILLVGQAVPITLFTTNRDTKQSIGVPIGFATAIDDFEVKDSQRRQPTMVSWAQFRRGHQVS